MAEAVVELLSVDRVIVPALLSVSVLMWAVIVLRYAALRRASGGDPSEQVVHALERERLEPVNVHHRRDFGSVLDEFIVEGAHVVHVHGPSPLRLEVMVGRASAKLSAYRSVLRSLVAAAPLLGLLGTVDGMIDTFASLHVASSLSGSEATVAGGISLALASTQLGLAVGVPGLVLMRLLERKEAAARRALHQARAALGGRS